MNDKVKNNAQLHIFHLSKQIHFTAFFSRHYMFIKYIFIQLLHLFDSGHARLSPLVEQIDPKSSSLLAYY